MIQSTWLLLSLLFCYSFISFVNGQCVTIRVKQAVHQPSINGDYHLYADGECDEHQVWHKYNPTTDTEMYIVYGTKAGDAGWVIAADEFCSLDAEELAVVYGPYSYPYDQLTYGNWYEMSRNSTWALTKLLLTCVNKGEEQAQIVHEETKVIHEETRFVHDDIYYEDASLGGAAIFGIVFGCLVVCIIICLVVLIVVRRRRRVVIARTRVYHGPPVHSVSVAGEPSTTLLIGAPSVAHCAVIGSPVYYQPSTSRVTVQQTRTVVNQSAARPVSRPPSYSKVSTRR